MRTLTPAQKSEIERWVLPLIDDLHRVARALCHNSDAAEELVADVVATACQSFHTLRDRSKTKPWLMKILSNRFISARRGRARYTSLTLLDDIGDVGSFSLFEELESALHADSNPEQEVIRKLMDEDFERALATLPEPYRLAVVLCDVEGYPYETIGQMLGIPVGTVRSRLARGRRMLQKRLWFYARDLGLVSSIAKSRSKGSHNDTETECACGGDQLPGIDQAGV
ncbi:MAG: RNA polymerase sigma factor [Bacteroidota bacterium]